MSKNVVIVGGGISGMATAIAILDLAEQKKVQPPRIQVLEANEKPGGKIRTIVVDDFACEYGVNGWLNKEPKTVDLCRRVGLSKKLLPATDAYNKRYLFARGQLHAVEMSPFKFMTSGLISVGGKARLMVEPLVSKGDPRGESIAQFARRRIGDEAFRVLVDPMQSGIYAGDPEKLSVAACFPRVVEVEEEYGSLIKGMVKLARKRKGNAPTGGPSGHLTSFRGGMQTLIDAMAQTLGPRLRCNATVESVESADKGFRVSLKGDEPVNADAVVLASPAFASARILAGSQPALADQLKRIDYPPLAVVCLAFKAESISHPLDGFGFLVPRNQGLRMLGSLWTSSIYPERAPTGTVLLRTMVGGARDRSILDMDSGELANMVLEELRPHLGIQGRPIMEQVFTHEKAIPQYELGHLQLVEKLDGYLNDLKGLHLTGNAYRGVSVNDCAKNAGPTAEKVLNDLEM
jgi:protoporphyrinogen/coproporphyrinogen III oxidase